MITISDDDRMITFGNRHARVALQSPSSGESRELHKLVSSFFLLRQDTLGQDFVNVFVKCI